MNFKHTFVVLTLVAVLAASCGDSNEDRSGDTGSSGPTPTTTTEAEPTKATDPVTVPPDLGPDPDGSATTSVQTIEPQLFEQAKSLHIITDTATFQSWGTSELTQAQWDDYEAPAGWIKDTDTALVTESEFLQSPGAAEPGPTTKAEYNGIEFEHIVDLVDSPANIDPDGLLNQSRILKHHVVTFPGDGNWIRLLVDPDGNEYILINRNPNRTEDIGPVPEGWFHRHVQLDGDLALTFSGEVTNIRDTIGDLYQGPAELPADLEADAAGG